MLATYVEKNLTFTQKFSKKWPNFEMRSLCDKAQIFKNINNTFECRADKLQEFDIEKIKQWNTIAYKCLKFNNYLSQRLFMLQFLLI